MTKEEEEEIQEDVQRDSRVCLVPMGEFRVAIDLGWIGVDIMDWVVW